VRRLLLTAVGALIVFQSGCVPIPEDELPQDDVAAPAQQAFGPLDGGGSEVDSQHFRIHAYSQQDASKISLDAESDYNRITSDTNLFSFSPAVPYEIFVYGSQDEFMKKTGEPQWANGICIGKSMYVFSSPYLNLTVSHQLTHLIFVEFMGSQGQVPDYLWVNEGLAVYEEIKAATVNGAPNMYAGIDATLRQQPIPIDQLVHLAPSTEKDYQVSPWYAESESIVNYIINRGGNAGFASFLGNLRNGQTTDAAVASAYTGVWTNLNGVYQSWLSSSQ